MKAGITLDDWKLPVFRKHLDEAGFKYKDGGEVFCDVTLLTVETDDILKLKRVLEAAHSECAKQGKP